MNTYICIYTYAYIHMNTCIGTCMHACMHTYIHTYVRTYVRTYVQTYMRTYVHTYIRTYVPTYLRTYVHTYIRTYVHTYIRTYVHTYLRTYVHTYIHTYIHTYTHTHASMHACMHECIMHTYTTCNIMYTRTTEWFKVDTETWPTFLGAWVLRAIPRWEGILIASRHCFQPSGRAMKLGPKTIFFRTAAFLCSPNGYSSRIGSIFSIIHVPTPTDGFGASSRLGVSGCLIQQVAWPLPISLPKWQFLFIPSCPARFWRVHLPSRFRIATMFLSRLGGPLQQSQRAKEPWKTNDIQTPMTLVVWMSLGYKCRISAGSNASAAGWRREWDSHPRSRGWIRGLKFSDGDRAHTHLHKHPHRLGRW